MHSKMADRALPGFPKVIITKKRVTSWPTGGTEYLPGKLRPADEVHVKVRYELKKKVSR
jgi:hypothetical protein